MTLPLKIFNRNEGGIARAQAERDRAENLTAQTRNQILLDIRKAYNSVQIHRERVTYIEKDAVLLPLMIVFLVVTLIGLFFGYRVHRRPGPSFLCEQ